MDGSGTLLANRYRMDERVGSGGMGEVWRATDQLLGRIVAVKVMRPDMVAQPDFPRRFLAEAQAMATIKHHAVVGIYDYHGDASRAFLVMEYVDGEALSDLLHRTGRLDPLSVMKLMAHAADALQAAHDKGVVHRDVKPANLLVTGDDTLVLTDFGIARSASSAQLTATGAVIGTPSYLAPEQVLGHPATARTDVYALGVVAYQCLTGQLPFSGDNPYAIATRRLQEAPPPIEVDAPAAVVEVVQRALAADPDLRWPSARELASAARDAMGRSDTAPAPGAIVPEAAGSDGHTIATVPNLGPPPPPAPEPQPTAPTVAMSAVPQSPSPVAAPPTPPYNTPPSTPATTPATGTLPPDSPPATRNMPRAARTGPPASVVLSSVLLGVAGACLAGYVAILLAVTPDVVTVTEDVMSVHYPTMVSVVAALRWAPAGGYAILALLLLLLAWQNSRGNRVARGWTFTLGVVTLLVAGPLGVVSAFIFDSLRPTTEYRSELIDVVPSSYVPLTIAAGLVAMGALLVALILLTLRPANRFFSTRSDH